MAFPEQLLTRGEAARLLGVSISLIRKLENEDSLPPIRGADGVHRHRRDNLERVRAAREAARQAADVANGTPPREDRIFMTLVFSKKQYTELLDFGFGNDRGELTAAGIVASCVRMRERLRELRARGLVRSVAPPLGASGGGELDVPPPRAEELD
jgi:hypothetical protein